MPHSQRCVELPETAAPLNPLNPAKPMPILRLHDVRLEVPERTILDSVSTELSEHRIGIIGANGSGKSTLVRLFNGLVAPTHGQVLLDDINVVSHPKKARARVGFVFSDAENQIIMPRVYDDVAFSLKKHKISRAEKDQRVREALAAVGLTEHSDDSPHTLSGGQKQLLALSAVLVAEPDIIIADEPTTLLDLRNRLALKKRFMALPQQLIVVTHDLDFLTGFDRVLWIDEGRIVGDGPPEDIIARYSTAMDSTAGDEIR